MGQTSPSHHLNRSKSTMKTMAADVSGGDHHQLAGLPLLQTLFPTSRSAGSIQLSLFLLLSLGRIFFFIIFKKLKQRIKLQRRNTPDRLCVCLHLKILSQYWLFLESNLPTLYFMCIDREDICSRNDCEFSSVSWIHALAFIAFLYFPAGSTAKCQYAASICNSKCAVRKDHFSFYSLY